MKKISAIVIIVLVICIVLVQVIAMQVTPTIISIAKKEMEQFTQLVVNHTSLKYTKVSDDFITIERDDNNQIKMINFDMPHITAIAGDIVLTIEELLLALENGEYIPEEDTAYTKRLQKISDSKGIIAQFPVGLLTDNPFFSNMGPKIKVRYQSLSRVSSRIEREIESYGINHIMISINIVISIRLMVVVPFASEEYEKEISLPLAMEIIEGEVPSWYQN